MHATPARKDNRGQLVPGEFDTVLVNDGRGTPVGVKGVCICSNRSRLVSLICVLGYRVGRVRTIFSIPKSFRNQLFPGMEVPEHLAYIEWFTAFTQPDPNHGLYKLSKAMHAGARDAAIIPLDAVRRSIHLYPAFGQSVPAAWSSSNVLDLCDKFWVNGFTDRHVYGTVI